MKLNRQQLRTLRQAPLGPGGNRLKLAILLAGESQISVGRALGVSNTYISNVCCGQQATLTLVNAYKFANAFGCAIEDLFPARTHRPVRTSRAA